MSKPYVLSRRSIKFHFTVRLLESSIFRKYFPETALSRLQIGTPEKIFDHLLQSFQVGIAIGNEIDEQDELIEDIKSKTGKVNDKLHTETKHTESVLKKSSTCFLWTIIVMLAIVIVVVAVLG